MNQIKIPSFAGMGGVRSTPTSESLRPAPNPVFDLRSFDIIKTRQERTERENTSFRPSRLLNGCAHAFRGSHGEWQKSSLPIRPPFSQKKKKASVRNNSRPSNRHAPQIRSAGSARCVQRFDDSLLQFTLLIAIRCVLHRWENQEIRCQKLFFRFRRPHYQSVPS